MKGTGKNNFFLWFCIWIGAIGGSFLGEFISSKFSIMSFLGKAYSIGLSSPFSLNLKVIELTFGLSLNINIVTIIGVIVAIILYRRY